MWGSDLAVAAAGACSSANPAQDFNVFSSLIRYRSFPSSRRRGKSYIKPPRLPAEILQACRDNLRMQGRNFRSRRPKRPVRLYLAAYAERSKMPTIFEELLPAFSPEPSPNLSLLHTKIIEPSLSSADQDSLASPPPPTDSERVLVDTETKSGFRGLSQDPEEVIRHLNSHSTLEYCQEALDTFRSSHGLVKPDREFDDSAWRVDSQNEKLSIDIDSNDPNQRQSTPMSLGSDFPSSSLFRVRFYPR